jgi:hypothetical protein
MPLCWLGSRAAVGTVTRFAYPDSTAIVNPGTTNEGCSGMARAAIQTGRNMIQRLADCGYTMTGIASCTAGHSTMIECCRYETTRGVTGATIRTGLNMAIYFAPGEDPIMASYTIIHDTGMIKSPRHKTSSQVTLTAITVGGDMTGGFASGSSTIVARCTVIHYTFMTEYCCCEGTTRNVADTAILGCSNMGQMLAKCCHTMT